MDDLKKHQLDTEATIFGHYKQKWLHKIQVST